MILSQEEVPKKPLTNPPTVYVFVTHRGGLSHCIQYTLPNIFVKTLGMKKAQLAMETMNGAAVNPPYEEFEPLCNWRHDDRRETLVVHLPAFKKEQLKIQISNLRNLKISGERPLEATKSSRFIKTIKIPRDCNAKEIRANFADGLLYIVMPRKDSSAPKQEHPPQLQNSKVNENSTPESSHDQATKLPTLAKADNATEKIASLNDAKLPENVAQDSRLKSLKMMATNVVVVAAAAACLGAYIMYSFRSLYVED